jgi:hypothetical protein
LLSIKITSDTKKICCSWWWWCWCCSNRIDAERFWRGKKKQKRSSRGVGGESQFVLAKCATVCISGRFFVLIGSLHVTQPVMECRVAIPGILFRISILLVGYLLDLNISLITWTYKMGVKTYNMYTYKIGIRPIHIPTR